MAVQSSGGELLCVQPADGPRGAESKSALATLEQRC